LRTDKQASNQASKQTIYVCKTLLYEKENKVLTWTVERIQDETQIKLELLLQVLLGLLKSSLLVCPDINEDEQIKTSYSIRLATDFKR
jgi:hypothetical protein